MSCSPVAQLVERVAVNHLVGGSSLSRGAKYQKGRFSYWKRPFFTLIRLVGFGKNISLRYYFI